MKSTRLLVLLVVLSMANAQCTPIRNWIKEIQENPIAGIMDAFNAVMTAVDMARSVYNVLAVASPEVEAQRSEFERYVADVGAGIDAGRSALHLVDDVRSADTGRIMGGAYTALESLYRFIAQIGGHMSAERLAAMLPSHVTGVSQMTVGGFRTRGLEVMRHALPPARRAALAQEQDR